MSTPDSRRIRSVQLAGSGEITHSPDSVPPRLRDGTIAVVADSSGARLTNGLKVLTEPFEAIESLDLDEKRQEVVFSVRREGKYDIGLVAAEGSAISWVPADPADEVAVQWAPRGSKISYIIRARGGDLVRTLHVPTSFEFAVPFENATIYAVAWDPQAERFAVAYSTIDASDRVEVLEYDGDARRMAVPPASSLEVSVEPFGPDAMMVRPRDIAYGERLPLVVWTATDYAWSDARAVLMKNARVAVLVTLRPLDDALWQHVEGTAWLDPSERYLVAAGGEVPGRTAGVVVITGDPAVPGGRYRRQGSVVTVPPAVVQSFAAGFIAEQLKRTTPTNGSRR